MRGSLIGLLAILMVAACGPSGVTIVASTPSNVSVQSSDVPKGMSKCSQSGDVNTYLNEVKTSDPKSYSTTKAEWDLAKKDGATGAQFTFYAVTKADCSGLSKASGGAPTDKLIGSVVIQFKDSTSASKGFSSESILGFKSSDLKALGGSGFTLTEGTKTGLGANSAVVSGSFGAPIWIAVWVNKAFYVILIGFNVDTPAMGRIATAINGRIH